MRDLINFVGVFFLGKVSRPGNQVPAANVLRYSPITDGVIFDGKCDITTSWIMQIYLVAFLIEWTVVLLFLIHTDMLILFNCICSIYRTMQN